MSPHMSARAVQTALLALLCALLGACQSGPPAAAGHSAQAAQHVQRAGRALHVRNDRAAGSEFEAALRQPGGDALLQDLFRTQPDAVEVFAGHVERGIRNATTAQAASHQAQTLALSRAASLLNVERQRALERLADETFAAANRSGAIPFTLDDDLSGLAMLQTDAQRHIIVERSIAFLVHGGGPRAIDGLLAHIDRIGRDSAQARAILARLPEMNIRRGELARIAPYAPDFARSHESRLLTRVALQLRIGDPQHEADFRALLVPQTPGVVWLDTPDPAGPTLLIEGLQLEARPRPEHTQTILYGPHEIHPGIAGRHMPRRGTYLYEVVTGGDEVEYAFALTLRSGGRSLHEERVRGSVIGETRRCLDARIRGVYGGVVAADFIANADMQARCASPAPLSVDALRTQALGEVVRAILAIPLVQSANERNF